MAPAVALDADQPRLHQLRELRPRQLVRLADIARDQKDRRLHAVLLQKRQERFGIVVVSVVKGQEHRLFILLDVGKIFEKDRLIAVFGQVLQLLFQLLRLYEQTFLAPAVVADGVVHENGDPDPGA